MPGIDVLFVGPWDLGNNLGFPVQGDFAPELKEAIAKIQKVAETAGKKSGIYCPNGDYGRKFADEGFQMVSDLGRLRHRLAEGASDLRSRGHDRVTSWHDRAIDQSQRLLDPFSLSGSQGRSLCLCKHGLARQEIVEGSRFTIHLVRLRQLAFPHLRR